MTNWKTYQQTYRTESTLFDYARTGDLRGLATLLSQEQPLEVDATNERGYSALMLAVYNGEKEFCEALLRYGADINSTDAMGNTVLMGAAYKGDVAIFSLLMQYGADINLNNKTNMNARDWALMFNRKALLLFLDNHYPTQHAASKLKNSLRFIKLAFIVMQNKLRASQ